MDISIDQDAYAAFAMRKFVIDRVMLTPNVYVQDLAPQVYNWRSGRGPTCAPPAAGRRAVARWPRRPLQLPVFVPRQLTHR